MAVCEPAAEMKKRLCLLPVIHPPNCLSRYYVVQYSHARSVRSSPRQVTARQVTRPCMTLRCRSVPHLSCQGDGRIRAREHALCITTKSFVSPLHKNDLIPATPIFHKRTQLRKLNSKPNSDENRNEIFFWKQELTQRSIDANAWYFDTVDPE